MRHAVGTDSDLLTLLLLQVCVYQSLQLLGHKSRGQGGLGDLSHKVSHLKQTIWP